MCKHCTAFSNRPGATRPAPDDMDGGVTCAAIEHEAGEDWLEARYDAALEEVGGDKANHLDAVTVWMMGADWGRIAAAKAVNRLSDRARAEAESSARCWASYAKEQETRADKAEAALDEMTASRDKSRNTAIKWQVEANRLRAEQDDTEDRAERAVAVMRGERDAARAERNMLALHPKQPRPLAADDITDEMVERARAALSPLWQDQTSRDRVRDIITAALTEPQRPEAKELADVIEDFDLEGFGIDGLADHLVALGWKKVDQ